MSTACSATSASTSDSARVARALPSSSARSAVAVSFSTMPATYDIT